MEKNFAYCVNAYFEKAETTLRTNDVAVALKEFMDYVEDGVTCDVVNGFTGEVLAIANNPDHEDYSTAEWALMIGGMLYLFDLAETQVEEEEDEPTCPMCGGSLDENGNCEYCGTVCNPAPVPVENGGFGLVELLEALVAEGKAVKLPS
jgi:hypothetical protein